MRALFFWLILLTIVAFVMGAMMPGVPFWLVWLGSIWPLPLAALVNWLWRNGRRRRADLNDAPAGYLRTEYRESRPATLPELIGRWGG
jgi:membrane protein implicated in regulation of membrane protease activity